MHVYVAKCNCKPWHASSNASCTETTRQPTRGRGESAESVTEPVVTCAEDRKSRIHGSSSSTLKLGQNLEFNAQMSVRHFVIRFTTLPGMHGRKNRECRIRHAALVASGGGGRQRQPDGRRAHAPLIRVYNPYALLLASTTSVRASFSRLRQP